MNLKFTTTPKRIHKSRQIGDRVGVNIELITKKKILQFLDILILKKNLRLLLS